jgi:predicted PurR-regulated permease PerM
VLSKYGIGTGELTTKIKSFAEQSVLPVVLSSVANILEQGVICIIFLLYMLSSPMATGVSKKSLAFEVDKSVRMYIKLKSFVNLLVGLFIGVIYSLLKLNCGWIFAVVTAIFNYIPNVGGVVSAVSKHPI